MNHPFVTLDVREDLRAGREPLVRIMAAVDSLDGGQALRLIAPFKPTPLFSMLGRLGFGHRTRWVEPGMWETVFEREDTAPISESVPGPASIGHPHPASVVEVDARGWEPPQPLVTILEAVEALPESTRLDARTDRRPIQLLPQLEARGLQASSEELPDGSFVTHIIRLPR